MRVIALVLVVSKGLANSGAVDYVLVWDYRHVPAPGGAEKTYLRLRVTSDVDSGFFEDDSPAPLYAIIFMKSGRGADIRSN